MSAEDEVADTQTETTEEVAKTTDESTEETSDVIHTEFEKKQFERAKKAETENKRLKAELEASKNKSQAPKSDFDLEDVATLVTTVPLKEDRELVKKYAKFEGISLEEALKAPVVKTLLKEKAEERRTAEVTNTSGSKRTTAKATDEQVIQRAADGKEFDPEALAEARMNLKKQQLKR